jgi:predicted alpha/beta-hydrolase family hydrolase
MSERFEAGFLHRPAQAGVEAIVLTHGASSNANAPMLVALAEAFANAGVLAYRYDLPYRQRRPNGPPHPSASAADREGVRLAVQAVRALGCQRVVAAGHSYGGRQTSMAASEDPQLVEGLLLTSYPLHPPGKPDQIRTAHFPNIHTAALFISGARDPFGSREELEKAIALIPAKTQLWTVEGAGHELAKKPATITAEIVYRTSRFLLHPDRD